VLIQFVRPPKNSAGPAPSAALTGHLAIPPAIHETFRVACYDCHSDSTRYPWYAEIQPVGLWLNGHIEDAKRHLNFSEFGTYNARRQMLKFEQIASEVDEEGMPLPSYLILHHDAKLSREQISRIVAWAHSMVDTLRALYPPDSLARRR
jgi:hypothetical protein